MESELGMNEFEIMSIFISSFLEFLPSSLKNILGWIGLEPEPGMNKYEIMCIKK